MKAIILARVSTQEQKEAEKQIDQLVYKLYGFTPEEIKTVARKK